MFENPRVMSSYARDAIFRRSRCFFFFWPLYLWETQKATLGLLLSIISLFPCAAAMYHPPDDWISLGDNFSTFLHRIIENTQPARRVERFGTGQFLSTHRAYFAPTPSVINVPCLIDASYEN